MGKMGGETDFRCDLLQGRLSGVDSTGGRNTLIFFRKMEC